MIEFIGNPVNQLIIEMIKDFILDRVLSDQTIGILI